MPKWGKLARTSNGNCGRESRRRLFEKLALCSMLGFSEQALRGTHSMDFPEDA